MTLLISNKMASQVIYSIAITQTNTHYTNTLFICGFLSNFDRQNCICETSADASPKIGSIYRFCNHVECLLKCLLHLLWRKKNVYISKVYTVPKFQRIRTITKKYTFNFFTVRAGANFCSKVMNWCILHALIITWT